MCHEIHLNSEDLKVLINSWIRTSIQMDEFVAPRKESVRVQGTVLNLFGHPRPKSATASPARTAMNWLSFSEGIIFVGGFKETKRTTILFFLF